MKTCAGQNYMTPEEESRLFRTVKKFSGFIAERDYVIMKTLRLTGLRRQELVRLNCGDVREKTWLVLDKAKACKGSVGEVYICGELREIFTKFTALKRRNGEAIDDAAPLFCNADRSSAPARLSARAVNTIVKKYADMAGVEITPHGFRHTKARRIMDDVSRLEGEEVRMKRVQKQLRHSSIASTGIYLEPTKEDMEEAGAI